MGKYAHEEKFKIQETLRVRRPDGIKCKSRESGEHAMNNTETLETTLNGHVGCSRSINTTSTNQ